MTHSTPAWPMSLPAAIGRNATRSTISRFGAAPKRKSLSQARSYEGSNNAILRDLKSPPRNWPGSLRQSSPKKRSSCKDSATGKAAMCVTVLPP